MLGLYKMLLKGWVQACINQRQKHVVNMVFLRKTGGGHDMECGIALNLSLHLSFPCLIALE